MGTKKLKWFKLYGSLHTKHFSQKLILECGLIAYARYIILLEECTRIYDDTDGQNFVFGRRELSTLWRCRPKDLDNLLEVSSRLMGYSATTSATDAVIHMPILSELLVADSNSWKMRTSAHHVQSKSKSKKENYIKESSPKSEHEHFSFEASENQKDLGDGFDAVYLVYPRKVGKKRGYEIFRSEIKKGTDPAEILVAVHRFVSYHRARSTEIRYIPHFSTWMNSWRDCLDPDFGLETNLVYNQNGLINR